MNNEYQIFVLWRCSVTAIRQKGIDKVFQLLTLQISTLSFPPSNSTSFHMGFSLFLMKVMLFLSRHAITKSTFCSTIILYCYFSTRYIHYILRHNGVHDDEKQRRWLAHITYNNNCSIPLYDLHDLQGNGHYFSNIESKKGRLQSCLAKYILFLANNFVRHMTVYRAPNNTKIEMMLIVKLLQATPRRSSKELPHTR